MWEANVRTTISAILASLRQPRPDFERMAFTVSDLGIEVGAQNLPGRVEPGAPTPTMRSQKACDTCAELESLGAALSDRNAPKAIGHAKAVLGVVGQ
jgi:hypothetical protein